MGPLVSAWLLGLVLGARHAFEPDHLAAMATLVSTERRSALLGALWGVGHTATLLGVGGALVIGRGRMPDPLADLFELLVAAMLLVLGARSLFWASRHHHVQPSKRAGLPRRPFFVGMAHGLAGSGALTALALAAMPSVATALVYLVLFGLGSVAAMSLASGMLGWPLARILRSDRASRVVASVAGGLSVVTGLIWGWRSAF
jgi:hypothetical protein